MEAMALLIPTDDWAKVALYADFLEETSPVAWRTQSRHQRAWISRIPFPLNVYFFKDSSVEWKGRCLGIYRDTGWTVDQVPKPCRQETKVYTLAVMLTELHPIQPVPIRYFPKQDDPSTAFTQGQLGLLRVLDRATTPR